jgi:hypothetical protein
MKHSTILEELNWFEPYKPTIARMVPRKMIWRWERLLGYERFSNEGKFAYVRLNIQTPSTFAKATARQEMPSGCHQGRILTFNI